MTKVTLELDHSLRFIRCLCLFKCWGFILFFIPFVLFSVSFYCVFKHITLLIEQLFSKLAGDAELFVLLTVLQARYIDQKKSRTPCARRNPVIFIIAIIITIKLYVKRN